MSEADRSPPMTPRLRPASLVPRHGEVGQKWRSRATRVEFQITARLGDLEQLDGVHAILWQCETADKSAWYVVTDARLGLDFDRIEAFSRV